MGAAGDQGPGRRPLVVDGVGGFISWASRAPTTRTASGLVGSARSRLRSAHAGADNRRRPIGLAAIVHRVILCGGSRSARPCASNTIPSRDRAAIRAAHSLFLEDGTLLDAAMLKAGSARLDLTRQFVREKEFQRLEEEAHAASVGIWIR